MTLCELESSGLIGWPDVAAVLLVAFLAGGAGGIALLTRLHRVELLAAREIGRRERDGGRA